MQKLEGFKVIADYPNYAVSQYGNVISLNYHHTGKIKLMKNRKGTNGYLQVFLYKDGKAKMKSVHRLVWTTWVSEIPENMQVNHIDENKENNCLDNLNLMSHKENCNYGSHNERSAKGKNKPVGQYTLDGELVKIWQSAREAGNYGFNQGAMCQCCRGKLKKHKGFIWKYEQEDKD